MTVAAQLLADLRARGFTLRAEAGQALLSPASRLTESEHAALLACKPDLLSLLEREQDEKAAAEAAAALRDLERLIDWRSWDRLEKAAAEWNAAADERWRNGGEERAIRRGKDRNWS